MAPDLYATGLEAWTGVLFYKQRLPALNARMQDVVRRIYALQPIGTPSQRAGVLVMQRRITAGLRHAGQDCERPIALHDRTLRSLTHLYQGSALTRLLRQAPDMFVPLAHKMDSLALVYRIVDVRLHGARAAPPTADEAVAILTEIEDVLSLDTREAKAREQAGLLRKGRLAEEARKLAAKAAASRTFDRR